MMPSLNESRKFFLKTKPWHTKLLVFLAGATLTAAFAPTHLFYLAFLCPAVLLRSILNSRPSRATLHGFLFGLGFYSTSISWIFNALNHYGEIPVISAVLFTLLFIMACAAFPALTSFLFARFFPRHRTNAILFAFPVLWIFSEWMMTWVLTGFPWMFIGYSQIDSPLRGFAPILGVYGVSLVTLICSSCIVLLFSRPHRWRVLLLAATLLIIGQALTYKEWTTPSGPATQVSLVQGNIMPANKWNKAAVKQHIDIYRNATEQHWNSKIIAWPETAVDGFENDFNKQLNPIREKAKQHNTAILTGIATSDTLGHDYTSIIVMGNGYGEYNKRHLVPLGEYVPLRSLLELLPTSWIPDLPMNDYSPGARHQANLFAAGVWVSPFLCYEIAYPELVRESVRENHSQAELMLTGSDDAWFGRSLAAPQHLEIGQMRSLETGRDQLFVANNGMTAIINSQGKVTAVAPRYIRTVLSGSVTPRAESTPWLSFGPWLLWLIGLIIIFEARRGQSTINKKMSQK